MRPNRFPLFFAAAVLSFAGCRCNPTVTPTRPDLRTVDTMDIAVTGLDFNACPTRDEMGGTVRDVFPDSKPVTLKNAGQAATKAKFVLSGNDADAFQVRIGGGDGGAFTGVPAGYEQDIGRNELVEFQVAFSPRKKGAHSATLTIDDQVAETTTDPVLTLVGSGLDLPAQATLETGVELPDGGFTVCEGGSILTDCELEFPITQFDTAITRKIRIKNKGCPALKITSLRVSTSIGTLIDSPDFRVVSPPAPSAASPISLNKVDATDSIDAVIEFKPTDTGMGNDSKSAFLIVNSNDPVNMDPISQPGVLQLRGEALRPSLTASPSSCDFTRGSDLCGNTAKVPDRARFVIRNEGTAPVRISEVRFKSSGSAASGQNGRFTLPMNPTGMTIAVGNRIELEVAHTDAALYVIDELIVKGTIMAGNTTIPAGEVSFALFGGRQPCLNTPDEVNFNNPMTAMSAQTFTIRNGRRTADGGIDASQCGTLVINQVGIEQNPFFSIIDPRIAPGTQVMPGASVDTGIQYNRPPSGGMQVARLRIVSNDPFFGPPAGTKEINVISASPFDPAPIGVLTGCIPASLLNDPNCQFGMESQMTISLSTITQNPKTLTLSGFNSTDADGTSTNLKPTEYRFQLLPPLPPNVTQGSLMPNMRGRADKAVLQLPGPGVYRTSMTVWDNRGQQGQPVNLIINVNQ